MKIEIFDKLNKQTICTADVDFGLNVVIVNSCSHFSKEYLTQYLYDRTILKSSYDMDEIVLKNLIYITGRMNLEECQKLPSYMRY